MNVTELNTDQLSELKHSLFYNFRYNSDERKELKKILSKSDISFLDDVNTCFWNIPDNLIYKVYDDIYFVNDDFFCSCEV